MPKNKITKEYFLEEYHRFRAILCHGGTSIEDKLEAWKGLLFVYVNLDPEMSEEDNDMCVTAMTALKFEVDMRLGFQATMEIEALFNTLVDEAKEILSALA